MLNHLWTFFLFPLPFFPFSSGFIPMPPWHRNQMKLTVGERSPALAPEIHISRPFVRHYKGTPTCYTLLLRHGNPCRVILPMLGSSLGPTQKPSKEDSKGRVRSKEKSNDDDCSMRQYLVALELCQLPRNCVIVISGPTTHLIINLQKQVDQREEGWIRHIAKGTTCWAS